MRANIELHFVESDEIRELNKKHRGVDKPTDVLAFPLREFNFAEMQFELGDIVFCKEHAEQDILFLLIHGLLHLVGYTHDTPEDEEHMNNLTFKILDKMEAQ